jgi:hypothetical protein
MDEVENQVALGATHEEAEAAPPAPNAEAHQRLNARTRYIREVAAFTIGGACIDFLFILATIHLLYAWIFLIGVFTTQCILAMQLSRRGKYSASVGLLLAMLLTGIVMLLILIITMSQRG